MERGHIKISTKDREQGGSIYLHLIRHTGVDFTSKHGAGYVQCMADGLPDGAGEGYSADVNTLSVAY